MARLLAFVVLTLAAAANAAAGEFGVSPIRVDLDRSTRSALVTVTNDDTRPLAFQVRALEWRQDAAGADKYLESSDLVYFPQQLRIPPKESRAVRVGYKVPAIDSERAYRLFIEEIADAPRAASQTGVAITLRFGVPLFLHPAAEHVAGTLELGVSGGRALALARNTGNVHFRITSVRIAALDASGTPLFEQALDGWYLLPGAQRDYGVALPQAICAKARALRAEASADKLVLRAEHALGPQDCR